MSIRLLVVDDHDLVREGLRMELDGTDILVVAEAIDGQAAFEVLKQQPTDVALVDVRMPHFDGFHFLELVRGASLSSPAIIMHTVNDGAENARRCRALGAKGLLAKGVSRQTLLDSVRRAYAGQELWDGDEHCRPASNTNSH